ncbi:MAG TPA: TetR/AcrR family transcriptional regulator [Candidatus Limnocylindrales bacterium]|nr:TetR/AcrR family transcriptional regulator [Candidatus Limnocylindrales bacterium]
MAPSSAERGRSDQILDAASLVFARLGFGAARMDDVASESGLSKGALYLYFKSKDQLIDALVGRIVSAETQRLHDTRAGDGSVADRLAAFGRAFAAELVALGPLAPVFPEVYARAMRHATVRAAFQRYLAGFRTELGALLAEGRASGELRPDFDPDQAALGVVGLMEGLALVWLVDREHIRIEAVVPAALDHYLVGLRASTPPAWLAAQPAAEARA